MRLMSFLGNLVTNMFLSILFLAIISISAISTFVLTPQSFERNSQKSILEKEVLGESVGMFKNESYKNLSGYRIKNFSGESGFISKVNIEKDAMQNIDVHIFDLKNYEPYPKSYDFKILNLSKGFSVSDLSIKINGVEYNTLDERNTISIKIDPKSNLKLDFKLNEGKYDFPLEFYIEISEKVLK